MRLLGAVSLLALVLHPLALGAATRAVFDNPGILHPSHGDLLTLRIADFNSDAKPDIAVLTNSSPAGARLFVYLGSGDGEFASAVVTTTPDGRAFDVADLDGDGIPDIAVAALSRVRIYRGNGDGSFTPGTEVPTTGSCSTKVVLADVTSDGRADILTCSLDVFPGLGSGNFGGAIHSFSEGDQIFADDGNGDGVKDIFVVTFSSTRWHAGNGDGSFASLSNDPVAGSPSAAADFNSDGRSDLAFFDRGSSDLGVRLAGPSGFPERHTGGFVPNDGSASAVTTGDLNGDGRPDILMGSQGHIYSWITSADGAPGQRYDYLAASRAEALGTADFDGDGHLDVVTAGKGDPFDRPLVVSIMRGGTGGVLGAPRAHTLSRQDGLDPTRFYGLDPYGAAIFDATGDGKPDAITIATIYAYTGAIRVYPGQGDGTIGSPIDTPLGSMNMPRPLFADFDGDGLIDIAIDVHYHFECWLANGDGTFSKSAELPGTISSPNLGAGDFNGDGNQDLVWFTSPNVHLYAGNGDGTFDPAIVAPHPEMSSDGFLVGDLNNDGVDDLIFRSAQLLGSTDGTFHVSSAGVYGLPTVLTDFDADGNLDFIFYEEGLGQNSGSVTVRRGNGDGTFGAGPYLLFDQRNTFPYSLPRGVVGDFNADGKVDLAFRTTVLLGDGAGWFDGYERLVTMTGPSGLAAGDLDGNGSDDLLLVNTYTHSMEIAPTWTTDSREWALSLTMGPAPATLSAGARLDFQVTASGRGGLVPTGGVFLALGGDMSSIAEIRDGVAKGSLRGVVMGVQQVTARFGGDDLYAGSSATPISIEVTRARTTIGVSSSPSGPRTTESVIAVKAGVYSDVGGLVTGTLTLFVDGVSRGSVAAPSLDIEIGTLSAGGHTLKVAYSGDPASLPSEYSWSISVRKVFPPMTMTTNPSTGINVGDPVTFTVTFPDHPAMVGTVGFYRAFSYFMGEASISGGVATFTMPITSSGNVYVQARLVETATYAPASFSAMLTVTDIPLPSTATSLYLLTPCRVMDTRGATGHYGGPALPATATREILLQGACGIPAGARAVALNLTVVSPVQVGFLTLFPGASPRTPTSTLNYRTGRTRANSAIVPLSAGGYLNIFNGGTNDVHFLIDVTGYFQ